MRGTIALLAALLGCSGKGHKTEWKVDEVSRQGVIRVARGGDLAALRLHGVMMPPESGPDTDASVKALRELVGGKQLTWVVVQEGPRQGHTIYGPDSVSLMAGAIDVNAELIKRGWARAVPASEGGPARLVELDEQARSAKVGAYSPGHRAAVVDWLRARALNVSAAPAGDLSPEAYRRLQFTATLTLRAKDLEFFGHTITEDDVGPPPCVDRLAGALAAAGSKRLGTWADILTAEFSDGATKVDVAVGPPGCRAWKVRGQQLVRTVGEGDDTITETLSFTIKDDVIDWTAHARAGGGAMGGGSGSGPARLKVATDDALLIGHEPWYVSVAACEAAMAAVPECKQP
jgi:endonuclease YncB( thermonuclease family)